MIEKVENIARLLRKWIVEMTTVAGSGHPTSSLSSVELMSALFFGGEYFRCDVKNPDNFANDRIIFSKGHGAPLLYALYAAAGAIEPEELLTLRKFGSRLEGHPSRHFPFTEVPTGSLGQGLSVGLGEALYMKQQAESNEQQAMPRVFVLLGDGEMAEGQVWEAMAVAAYYQLGNLIAIVDMSRLEQSGETMVGRSADAYKRRAEAFGWEAHRVNGHNLKEILSVYDAALSGERSKPIMIVADTIKGKGVSFLENKDGWHGKVLSPKELSRALKELGEVDERVRAAFSPPVKISLKEEVLMTDTPAPLQFTKGEMVATREAYGKALIAAAKNNPRIVALDAEVENSTYAAEFAEAFPDRFFPMFIAEQNMVSAALGMAKMGARPFVSSFAAFLTRAFDQVRMAQYARLPLVLVGSHAGVSLGADGASQMGLEDVAMFRALLESTVLIPADTTAVIRLVEAASERGGITYIRTARMKTPVLYDETEAFPVGGSKILVRHKSDCALIVAAGVTVHEAIRAAEELAKQNIFVRVMDAYSVKPIDASAILENAKECGAVITVEDHYPEGGLGAAVRSALAAEKVPVHSLAVRKIPRSGEAQELLRWEEIDARAVAKLAASLGRS